MKHYSVARCRVQSAARAYRRARSFNESPIYCRVILVVSDCSNDCAITLSFVSTISRDFIGETLIHENPIVFDV